MPRDRRLIYDTYRPSTLRYGRYSPSLRPLHILLRPHMVMAPPSTASAGARKLGGCAERCCLSRSFDVHHWFLRRRHSVGGAECRRRQLEVSGRPWRDREVPWTAPTADSTSGDGFVPTTRTTSPPPPRSGGGEARACSGIVCGKTPRIWGTSFWHPEKKRDFL